MKTYNKYQQMEMNREKQKQRHKEEYQTVFTIELVLKVCGCLLKDQNTKK